MGIKFYIGIALLIGLLLLWQWDRHEAKIQAKAECELAHKLAEDKHTENRVAEQKKELQIAKSELESARIENAKWKARAQELEVEKNKPHTSPTIIYRTKIEEHCSTVDIDLIRMFNDTGELYRSRISKVN